MTNKPETVPVEMKENTYDLEPGRMVSIPQSVAKRHNLKRGSVLTGTRSMEVLREALEERVKQLRANEPGK